MMPAIKTEVLDELLSGVSSAEDLSWPLRIMCMSSIPARVAAANHRLPAAVRARALSLVRERYGDARRPRA